MEIKKIHKTHNTKKGYTKSKQKGKEKQTADPDRGTEMEEIRLREKDLSSVDAEASDLRLR